MRFRSNTGGFIWPRWLKNHEIRFKSVKIQRGKHAISIANERFWGLRCLLCWCRHSNAHRFRSNWSKCVDYFLNSNQSHLFVDFTAGARRLFSLFWNERHDAYPANMTLLESFPGSEIKRPRIGLATSPLQFKNILWTSPLLQNTSAILSRNNHSTLSVSLLFVPSDIISF